MDKTLKNYEPFSSCDLGLLNGNVTVVSAVSIGADDGLVVELFCVPVRRTNDGVLGVSDGFVASSNLNYNHIIITNIIKIKLKKYCLVCNMNK